MLLRPASKKKTKRNKSDSRNASISIEASKLGWSTVLKRAEGLLMSTEQLEMEGYNSHVGAFLEAHEEASTLHVQEDARSLVSLDCEMVETTNGEEAF